MASTSTADWANLTAGPAGQIAERVLCNDYVDFVRFRAACRAWRKASAHLRAHGVLDRRFHPRRWILLRRTYKRPTTRRHFLNVDTGELIRVKLQRLLTCDLLGPTAEGLLVLCRRDGTRAVQLLNPLTGQIAILPSASSLVGADGLGLRGAGLAGDSMVALHFGRFSLSVARPGDMFWTRLAFHDVIRAALPFQGRICLANSKNISTVEAATASQEPPRHAVAAVHGRGAEAYLKNDMFLANNDGELILGYHIHSSDEPCNHRRCSVHRVNLESGDVASLATLKGRALFTGTTRSVLVSTEVSPCVDADTVYVCTFEAVAREPKVVACDITCTSAAAEVEFDRGDTAFYLARYVCS